MKGYSLTRRLIYTVLLLELALALCTTGASLLYERSQRLHSYDIMLRGRADSLLGAVKDADDPADNATIDPKALDLKTEDLWEVRYPSGRVLGHSEGWTPEMESGFKSNGRGHNFSALGKRYRGLIIHGIRQIDQEGNNPGISRPVVIYYAASLKPVSEALAGAANFLLLANSLLLLLTGAALFVLLRRGLRPLQELKDAAAAIDSIHWQFRAPASASDVQELGVLAAALDSAMLRLEQSFRRQQTFVHNAAHELKTAVTIIKSSLQLLASRQRTAEEYARGLETCLADCERMEELVQRMLLLARFEQRDAHVLGRPESTDLAQRVHECVAQLQSFAELRRVALRLEREDSIFVPLSVRRLRHPDSQPGDERAGTHTIRRTSVGILADRHRRSGAHDRRQRNRHRRGRTALYLRALLSWRPITLAAHRRNRSRPGNLQSHHGLLRRCDRDSAEYASRLRHARDRAAAVDAEAGGRKTCRPAQYERFLLYSLILKTDSGDT